MQDLYFTDGINFEDWKSQNQDVGKLGWGKYDMDGKFTITLTKSKKRYSDALEKIVEYFQKIQDLGCSHTFSALAMQRTFGKPINKFTIKNSYNEFVKQNQHFALSTLMFAKLNIKFKENYFSDCFSGAYYVVNFSYDVPSGDLILDVVNRG